MPNDKKIPWFTLILQTIYLSIGVFFHMVELPQFRQMIEKMDIELPLLSALTLDMPIIIAAFGGVFLIFLWAWKFNWLENKFILLLINVLPIVFIFLAFVAMSPPMPPPGNWGA